MPHMPSNHLQTPPPPARLAPLQVPKAYEAHPARFLVARLVLLVLRLALKKGQSFHRTDELCAPRMQQVGKGPEIAPCSIW